MAQRQHRQPLRTKQRMRIVTLGGALLLLLPTTTTLAFHTASSIVTTKRSSTTSSGFLPRRTDAATITTAAFLASRPSMDFPPGRPSMRLFAGNDNDDVSFLNSDDPFRVLQIASPTADAKEIRKAYRRMAVRFHPDVTTNKDSTAAEKKIANDRFAKINWAYQTLSGKGGGAGSSAAGGSPGSSSSSSSGWEPPHRRKPGYASASSSSSQRSTDWRDYIPYGEKETYDTGGDSFEKIFSDLFQAASAGASSGMGGGASILNDFFEFLEQGSTGFGGSNGFGSDSSFSSSSAVDDELRILLNTGSVAQVGDALDDAQLVQQQLETKLDNLQSDAVSLTADLKFAIDLKEKMQTQEELAAVQARIPVVQDYLKQARQRVLALQTRYKELIVNDRRGGSSSSTQSVWDEIRNEAASSSSRSTRSTNQRRSSSSSSSSSESDDDDEEDAWKSDSFGSFGRGRGRGSRSRAGRSRSSGTSSSQSSSSRSTGRSSYETASRDRTYASSSSASSFASSSRSADPYTPSTAATDPPNRRSAYTSQYEEDKRRLRELKVDEEFDKLKKDLGLS